MKMGIEVHRDTDLTYLLITKRFKLGNMIRRGKKCAVVDEECICSIERLLPKCIYIELSSCVCNNISKRLSKRYN